jgi:sulfur dioxygenase
MLFRQLFDATSSTYTYLLACPHSHDAVLIDPVYEQHTRDAALLRELGLQLRYVLETHVHADHVTGAWLLREAFGARIVYAEASGVCGADLLVVEGDRVPFGRRHLEVRETPGHTDGCLTYVLDNAAMAFTGDALLIRGAGRTDFQQGSAATLYRSITRQLFSLPDTCLLYPAHDYAGRTVTTVAEERQFNPRVGGEASEGDFVGFMNNLALPHPKQLDVAVPANLQCGRPADGQVPAQPAWGPVVTNYAGLPEVDPVWVNEHLTELHLLDVREPAELTGELGALPAQHIPLGELRARLSEVPSGQPVITVCRSGKRSAQAAAILAKAGRADVANLPGGMLRWRALGLS